MNWYYSELNQQKGPVSKADLMRMAREGRLRNDTLVWHPDFGEQWREAGTVPGLIPVEPVEEGVSTPESPHSALVETPRPATGRSSEGPFPGGGTFTYRAREALRGGWGNAVSITLIVFLISIATNVISRRIPIAGLLVIPPLNIGLAIVFLRIARRQEADAGQLFKGFQVYLLSIGLYLLKLIFTLLWAILLIIPGIIAAISYSQAEFLLADHPQLSPIDAIRSSKVLMDGRKWSYFCLCLRFFGWSLLCAFLTMGIGFLWLVPYMQTALAEFYLELRARQVT